MRPAIVILLSVLLMLSGWSLWREHRRAEALQNQLVAAENRVAGFARAEQQPGRPPSASPAGDAKPPVAPAANEPSPSRPRSLSDTERKFQRQMNEYRRWTALAKNAELLTTLSLAPEKLAALKDLLAEREFVDRDARDAARGAGVDPSAAAVTEVGKIDARIQALLGDADYATYIEQLSIGVFRQQLETSPIPGCLVDAGEPLSPEQKNWIALVMYRTLGAEPTDGASTLRAADPNSPREAFKQAVLARAPEHLTPAQVQALREYFRKDDELAGHMNTLIREQGRPK